LPPGTESSNHYLWCEYASGLLRVLRDTPPAAGSSASWSRVNELGNADHYWFARYYTFCCGGMALNPHRGGYTIGRTLMELALAGWNAASSACGGPEYELGPEASYDSYSGAGRVGRGAGGRTSLLDEAADAILGSLSTVVGGAGVPAMVLMIPMWELYKRLAIACGMPWMIPGNSGASGEASSDPSVEQMLWAYRGMLHGYTEDAMYISQYMPGSALERAGVSMPASLDPLPPGPAPAEPVAPPPRERWSPRA
jgi:hypothetical protein